MKHLTLVLILIGFVNCSSSSVNDIDENPIKDHGKRNERLLESFGVEEAVLENFKTKEKKTAMLEKPSKKKSKTKIRSTIRPKPYKLKFKEKNKSTKVSAKVRLKYNKEYPENLISISNNVSKIWSKFSPRIFVGEKTRMDINYMGISTGNITISVNENTSISGEEVYFLNARLKTASYYSYLYELDDNIDSYVLMRNFIPVKYSMIQRESGQDIDDLQLFDHGQMKNFYFYKRLTKKNKKQKKKKGEVFVPEMFQDPLSIIFFLRGLPMKKGDVYNVPIVNKEKIIMLNTKVVGTENLNTEIGKKSAIKMKVTTKYTGDTLKSGDMTFWFSNDEKRIFLKFKAKIKIGSISGDIDKYELN